MLRIGWRHPCSTGLATTSQQGELLALLADIKQFDIQNLSLDLPHDIRARIERALIGWGGLTVFRPEVNGQKAGMVKAF